MSPLNLFNLTDPVNNSLLEEYGRGNTSQALIAEIHGPEGIIRCSSLQVVDVLEMKNVNQEVITRERLFEGSLS